MASSLYTELTPLAVVTEGKPAGWRGRDPAPPELSGLAPVRDASICVKSAIEPLANPWPARPPDILTDSNEARRGAVASLLKEPLVALPASSDLRPGRLSCSPGRVGKGMLPVLDPGPGADRFLLGGGRPGPFLRRSFNCSKRGCRCLSVPPLLKRMGWWGLPSALP